MNEISGKFPMKITTSKEIDDEDGAYCPGCEEYLEPSVSVKVVYMGEDYEGSPITFCQGCVGKAFKLAPNEKIEITGEEFEIARLAVENVLIEFRDSRISMIRNNGLVCKEKDGKPSDIIRLGMEDALNIAIKAINEARASRG